MAILDSNDDASSIGQQFSSFYCPDHRRDASLSGDDSRVAGSATVVSDQSTKVRQALLPYWAGIIYYQNPAPHAAVPFFRRTQFPDLASHRL